MRRSQMLNAITEVLVYYGVDRRDRDGIDYELLEEVEKYMTPRKRMLPLKYDNNGKQLQAEFSYTWEDE